jgi:hypothetical protein
VAERYLRSKKTGKVMSESELFGYDSMGLSSPAEVFDAYSSTGQYDSVPEPKTLGGFAGNVVKSGVKLVGDVAGGVYDAAVTIPVENLKRGVGYITGDPVPDPPKASIGQIGTAVKDYVSERYGSPQRAWDTFYQDPAGVASDASTILGGASSVAKISKLPRLSRGLKATADVIDPLTAVTKVPQRVLNRVADSKSKLVPDTAKKAAAIPRKAGTGWYKSVIGARVNDKSLSELDDMASVGVRNEIPVNRAGITKADDMRQVVDMKREAGVADAAARGVTVDTPQALKEALDRRRAIQSATGVEGVAAREAADKQLKVLANDLGSVYNPNTISVSPATFPIDKANEARKATNRVTNPNRFNPGFNEESVVTSKKALSGIIAEIDSHVPNFKEDGILERDLINLIDALEDNAKKTGNNPSSYTPFGMSQGGKALTGNPSWYSAAAIVKSMNSVAPGLASKIAIAIARDHTVASKLRSKLNAMSVIGRLKNRRDKGNQVAATTDPPMVNPNAGADPYAVPGAPPVNMEDPFGPQ